MRRIFRARVLQTGRVVLHAPAVVLHDDPQIQGAYLGGAPPR